MLTPTKFDSSLGTLTGVMVEVDVDKTGGLAQGDNDSAVSGDITFTQSMDVSFENVSVAGFLSNGLTESWSD